MAQLASKQLSQEDFDYVRQLLVKRAGISLADGKMSMVQGRLARRARELNLPSLSAYLDIVRTGDSEELVELTNALTTNLTSFFREVHHFESLAKLVKSHADQRNRKLRIWSSACSTGQEPYSIAMTLRDTIPSERWDVKVLATDLDSNVLATARAGEYKESDIGALSAEQRSYFQESAGNYTATDSLKSLITFRQLNLLDTWPMRGPFDVVFCRNVLIYFGPELQRQLVDRFSKLLRPGGYLYLGHSESLCGNHPDFESLGRTTFAKKG